MWCYCSMLKIVLGRLPHVRWLKILTIWVSMIGWGRWGVFQFIWQTSVFAQEHDWEGGRMEDGESQEAQNSSSNPRVFHWPGLGEACGTSPALLRRRRRQVLPGFPRDKGPVTEHRVGDQKWSKCWANVFKPSHSKMLFQFSRIQASSSI